MHSTCKRCSNSVRKLKLKVVKWIDKSSCELLGFYSIIFYKIWIIPIFQFLITDAGDTYRYVGYRVTSLNLKG
jgi:hypothetical protein